MSGGGGACSIGRRRSGRLGSILGASQTLELITVRKGILPMMLGAKRKMFSLGSSRAADLDLFLEGVRLDGVDAEPFPLGESSLSSAARAAFCRRVRALIVDVCGGTWGAEMGSESTRNGPIAILYSWISRLSA